MPPRSAALVALPRRSAARRCRRRARRRRSPRLPAASERWHDRSMRPREAGARRREIAAPDTDPGANMVSHRSPPCHSGETTRPAASPCRNLVPGTRQASRGSRGPAAGRIVSRARCSGGSRGPAMRARSRRPSPARPGSGPCRRAPPEPARRARPATGSSRRPRSRTRRRARRPAIAPIRCRVKTVTSERLAECGVTGRPAACAIATTRSVRVRPPR